MITFSESVARIIITAVEIFCDVVIPLTHHKNGCFTELKVVGVYLSPATGGGKMVPAPLKGLGITFMVVGLMGMAFMTFMGISL